jgi:hypothetical protein
MVDQLLMGHDHLLRGAALKLLVVDSCPALQSLVRSILTVVRLYATWSAVQRGGDYERGEMRRVAACLFDSTRLRVESRDSVLRA